MCRCLNLYYVYNNNCNNKHSFVIFICLQPFCKPHFFIMHTTIHYSAYNIFVSATLIHQIFTAAIFKHETVHKTETITFDSCPHCQAFLYIHMSSVCRMFSNWKVHHLAFQRSLPGPFVYAHSRTCVSLMLTIAGLGVRCIYQRVFAYTLPFTYVALALSISLMLMLLLAYL